MQDVIRVEAEESIGHTEHPLVEPVWSPNSASLQVIENFEFQAHSHSSIGVGRCSGPTYSQPATRRRYLAASALSEHSYGTLRVQYYYPVRLCAGEG